VLYPALGSVVSPLVVKRRILGSTAGLGRRRRLGRQVRHRALHAPAKDLL